MRRLVSLFSRSSGLVDQIFFQWLTGKPVKGEKVVGGVAEHGQPADIGGPGMPTMTSSWGMHMFGVGLGEDCAVGGGDHLAVAARQ